MKKILSKVTLASRSEIVSLIDSSIREHSKLNVVTANPEIFMISESNEALQSFLLDDKTTITPDGIGVVKAYNKIFNKNIVRVPGVDTVFDMLDLANREGYSICVFGGKQETIDAFKIKLETEYPNIKDYQLLDGYTNSFEDALEVMKKHPANMNFIAQGVPRQENFMNLANDHLNEGVFIGCGGSIDVLSGMVNRAPKLIMKLNLEWLYRIILNPSRFKRFWNNQVKFVFKIRKINKERE